MTDRLTEILEAKQQHVATRQRALPLRELEGLALDAPAPRGFARQLRACRETKCYGLIAEMKRASPSRGAIRNDFVAAAIARSYQGGGATCLSVLTDTPYFSGRDEDLHQARAACALPVLRKDFIIDPYQIAESRYLGADCILLIVAALDDAQVRDFRQMAQEFGMDALVEVHDQPELDRALAIAPTLLGINNRNLKTLQVDLGTSGELARHVPADILLVSESGLSTPRHLAEMEACGITTFLIGESLLRHADIEAATRELLVDKPVELN